MRGQERLYNIISIIFVILTLVTIVGVGVIYMTSAPEADDDPIPAEVMLPTVTNTPLPPDTPTLEPPTFTPTFTLTPTLTLTRTLVPSLTPSNTPTPSPTITSTLPATLTPTQTNTPTATVGPTEPPPPPLPFSLQGQPAFTSNFANTAGCAWQGIGGQIVDINGSPYSTALVVHVFSAQQDFPRVQTGTNSYYGQQSGFEVQVGNAITAGTFFVELESLAGTVIAPRVTVTFPGTCEENVALVTFQQVRSLNP